MTYDPASNDLLACAKRSRALPWIAVTVGGIATGAAWYGLVLWVVW